MENGFGGYGDVFYGYGGAPPPGDAAEGSGLAELEYSFDDWEVSTDDDNSP